MFICLKPLSIMDNLIFGNQYSMSLCKTKLVVLFIFAWFERKHRVISAYDKLKVRDFNNLPV